MSNFKIYRWISGGIWYKIKWHDCRNIEWVRELPASSYSLLDTEDYYDYDKLSHRKKAGGHFIQISLFRLRMGTFWEKGTMPSYSQAEIIKREYHEK